VTVLLPVLIALLTLVAVAAVATLVSVRRLSRRFDAAVHQAVAAALADDREREMAEARAFWAEQEARAAEDGVFGGDVFGNDVFGSDGLGGESFGNDGYGTESLFGEDGVVVLPAPRGYADDEGEMDPEFADALRTALEELISESNGSAGHPVAHPAPHPSLPGFTPQPTPTPEWTDLRLEELVSVGTTLRDVRPGPMGTLDVYVFEDETTLCVAPGVPAAGARLREAVLGGEDVRLLGSSRLTGAHALTFALGDGRATVYILADRVVASL
jgi:hypothetical protein